MYRKRKAGQQMKAKFEEFNDGIADVCSVNGEDRLEKVKEGLRFGNENVGITGTMRRGQQIPARIV